MGDEERTLLTERLLETHFEGWNVPYGGLRKVVFVPRSLAVVAVRRRRDTIPKPFGTYDGQYWTLHRYWRELWC